MVGYNVGGGGGGGGGSDYKNDTLKPEFALEGYTFHAGENNNQQVGKIKNFDGKVIEGVSADSIPVSAKTTNRYIPAGTYLSRDVSISPVLTEKKEVSPSLEDQIIKPTTGKFLSEITVKGFDFREFTVYPDDGRTIYKINMGIHPMAISLVLKRTWDDDSTIDPIIVGLYVVRDGLNEIGYSYGQVSLAETGNEVYSGTFSNVVDQVTWGNTSFEIYLNENYFDDFLSYNVLVFGVDA